MWYFLVCNKPEGSILEKKSLSFRFAVLHLAHYPILPLPGSFTVKYIKEMSAFFKSAGSPGANLPWDSPPSTPQRSNEVFPIEVKEPRIIPLRMCQVSRKECPPDTENRYYILDIYHLNVMFNSVNIFLRTKLRLTDKLQNYFERLSQKGFFFMSYFDILFNMWNFLFSLKLCSLWGFSYFFNRPFFPFSFLPPPPPLITLARYFEVISSNRKNSMFLRAKDPAMAQSWYNAIQAAAASLLPQVKEEMKSMQPGMDVKHLGWLTEQVWKDTGVHGKRVKGLALLF